MAFFLRRDLLTPMARWSNMLDQIQTVAGWGQHRRATASRSLPDYLRKDVGLPAVDTTLLQGKKP